MEAVANNKTEEAVRYNSEQLFVPDCIFPSENDFEIPTLRLDVQPRYCEIPFVCFGEQKRTFQMKGKGTLHFYTDDYRFTGVWEKPEKIIVHEPANIVEPNFSLFNEMPISFGLQHIYKKRFIARAMQERGIGVFVDLNVANKFYKLNLFGVPAGYRAFATRGYSDRLSNLEFEYQMALSICGNAEDLLFVIYGGGELCRQFAKEHHCIYVTPVVTMKKDIKAIQRIKQSVAFGMFDELKIDNIYLEAEHNIRNSQIIDFKELQLKG